MSDKDRQKKDHKRKDKENKDRDNSGNQQAAPRHQANGNSNITESNAGADSARTGRPFISGGTDE
jgi:hypothetical protein